MSGNETLVDRVVQRLKAQPLGDLITEEDLHDIVKQAIPKAFFERRRVQGRFAGDWVDADPMLMEVMRELLKDQVSKAVKTWLAENKDKVLEYWKKVCDAGILGYVQEIQNQQATMQVREVLAPLLNKLNEERARHGLPYLQL